MMIGPERAALALFFRGSQDEEAIISVDGSDNDARHG
jgi:hypothetical protein